MGYYCSHLFNDSRIANGPLDNKGDVRFYVFPGGLKLNENVVGDEGREVSVTVRNLAGFIVDVVKHVLHAIMACKVFSLRERQPERLAGLVQLLSCMVFVISDTGEVRLKIFDLVFPPKEPIGEDPRSVDGSRLSDLVYELGCISMLRMRMVNGCLGILREATIGSCDAVTIRAS